MEWQRGHLCVTTPPPVVAAAALPRLRPASANPPEGSIMTNLCHAKRRRLQLRLAERPGGRIILWVWFACGGGSWARAWSGIRRSAAELGSVISSWFRKR